MRYILTKEDDGYWPVLGRINGEDIEWFQCFIVESGVLQSFFLCERGGGRPIEKEFTATCDEEAIKFASMILKLKG